jgi:SSS family solute:Na+ symporter
MNQFVIQRVLGARDAYHARVGLIFSGMLFLILGFVIIAPGLIIFALRPEILLQDWSTAQVTADRSYVTLIHDVLPTGVRGLVLAALFGAVQSTVNSVLNSTATIFAMDVYKARLRPECSDRSLVRVAIWTSVVTLILAMGIAILVSRLEMSVFYYMQLLNAFVAAPFAAVFILGVLWRRMNTAGAIMALTVGFASAVVLKFAPDHIESVPRWARTILNQAAMVLAISLVAGVIGALLTRPPRADQISDELTFRWSNPHLRTGYGRGPVGRVSSWWIAYALMTAAVFAYFSPLVFN